jgi:hypothetical protein
MRFELLTAITVKSVVFIGVMTYYPIIIPGRFGVTLTLTLLALCWLVCLDYSLFLKMEAVSFSETSINFYNAAGPHRRM